MEIVNSILLLILIPIMFVSMWIDHLNMKSNKELMKSIHESNDIFESFLDELKASENLTESYADKSNAQYNFNRTAIMILARRIHDLEESNAK